MKDCTCKVPTTSDVHSLTTCVCCGGYIVANAGLWPMMSKGGNDYHFPIC